MTDDALLCRWMRLFPNTTGKNQGARFRQILDRYAEPHRHYHTVRHLAECFTWLDTVEPLMERPDVVAMAIWFHDAIYDTTRRDNEIKSAELCVSMSPFLGAEHLGHAAATLILLTSHHAPPIGPDDAALFLDIDLSILGARSDRFAEYERDIRAEYAWVPEDEFRAGRSRVLRAFADRDHIYATEYFRDRLEMQARLNINGALRGLGAT